MTTVEMTGFNRGRTITKNRFTTEHPSMAAASSSSFGIVDSIHLEWHDQACKEQKEHRVPNL